MGLDYTIAELCLPPVNMDTLSVSVRTESEEGILLFFLIPIF